MCCEWLLSKAKPSDSAAIASLFALSWTSPFTRLQFGNVDAQALSTTMAPFIEQQIKQQNRQFVVIRQPATDEVVAVAQWTLPVAKALSEDEETPEENNERQQFEDEAYRKKLPDSSNKDLILEFTVGLRELKQQVLQGRQHFLLENVATHPDFRGRGFARRLVEWVFPQADVLNVLVYLDTASDNPAMRLYQKLGFEEKGRHTIQDLSKFVTSQELEVHGASNDHTHVAFIRYPNCVS
ncbi:acyl-CoA N-acyltransferase [Dothidotthia symphoricarpi CBS 119687]|uniref:Acyl-CoA N-acyltransferase n=1 Tax=Dothidotthia symphoricarpi CBS 119687 TaxID=1392245 RepID=A0A6A6AF15_9PLEO|nr:acyl-CoA N-acyltransferase [Dothidotthia symphoricarpi CBS 119687]KAF2130400.1 acyl-CoA N-acyltransferase [Dothidotthia symphoricarpi CBS 119687]